MLWYAARVSGLMAWILAFGALAAGLLARSTPERETSAGLWAADTRNLLGRLAVLAIVVHGVSITAAERFDLPATAVLIARDTDGWLAAGFVVGTICAWTMVAVELVRLVVRRLPVLTELLVLAAATAVVLGGAYHGWQVGSDTRNPLTVAVVVVCGVLLIGAGAIGFTTFMAPALTDDRGQPDSGSSAGEAGGHGPIGRPDDLFQSRQPTGPNEVSLSLSLSHQVEPPELPAARGPEIPSARDIAVPGNVEDRQDGDDQSSWTMRKLPDAPKPQHRRRPRR